MYAWEFAKDGQAFTVKAEGQLVFNSIMHVLNAAVDGVGLAYVPEPLLAPYLADGRLQEILADWCPTFEGYHLYYPNRRQPSPAFTAFVDAIKYTG
ncbi:LysR substrate-binding domain-containing protein [Comamonas piscis]